VTELADRIELQDLLTRYAHALDTAVDEDDFVDLFTKDAVLLSPVSGRHEGVEGVRQFFRKTKALRADVQIRHMITNCLVEVSDDTASVKAYLLSVWTPRNAAPPYLRPPRTEISDCAEYSIKARREDGRWRICWRAVHPDDRHVGDGLQNDTAEFFE
jgi:ketosteroid isomerase-like protein